VCIELKDGQRYRFLLNKSPAEIRRIKEDNLWRLLHSNSFHDAIRKDRAVTRKGKGGSNNSSPEKEPNNRYVILLRGFLSYWLQKKFSSLGVVDD